MLFKFLTCVVLLLYLKERVNDKNFDKRILTIQYFATQNGILRRSPILCE